jgi:pimeloyl-ACP methyl ester carboxylesterase
VLVFDRPLSSSPALCALVFAVAATGCIIPGDRPTVTPIRQVRLGPELDSPSAERAGCYVVVLPGFGETPESLIGHQIPARIAEEVDADVTLVDAHVGYYYKQSVVERLHEDVIEPAREAGYDKIWIVAISLGSLGALGYGTAHADDLEGIVVIAPWLGDWGYGPYYLRDEIEDAGGYRAWHEAVSDELVVNGSAELGPMDDDAFFRQVMAWAVAGERPDGTSVPIYVGYPSHDRYVRSQRLLAEAQPERHRLMAIGEHQFEVFYDLLRGFLWQGFMQRSCGRADAGASGARSSGTIPSWSENESRTSTRTSLRRSFRAGSRPPRPATRSSSPRF